MKTVKIRIAVAIDPLGKWVSAGWYDASDEELMDIAVDSVAMDEAQYFITVELEIPEVKIPKEIKASRIKKIEKNG